MSRGGKSGTWSKGHAPGSQVAAPPNRERRPVSADQISTPEGQKAVSDAANAGVIPASPQDQPPPSGR
jgi:hypothetical protein